MTLERSVVKEYLMGDAGVWLLGLREISEADFRKMYALCSEERRKRADRIKPEWKRKQSIGAGYLLSLLKERFSIKEEPVVLPGGKPVFREEPGVYFSISHSGGIAVLAFGDRPLGVDVECVKEANLKVAERFFTEGEYKYLLKQKEDERGEVFYRMWTEKEAVVKAAGSGLLVPLDRFSVLDDIVDLEGKKYELCRRKLMEGKENAWISTAQLKTDQAAVILYSPGQKEKKRFPEVFPSDGLPLSEKL